MLIAILIDHQGREEVRGYRTTEEYLANVKYDIGPSIAPMGTVHENVDLVKSLDIYPFYKVFLTQEAAKDAIEAGSLPMSIAHKLDQRLQRLDAVAARDAARNAQPKAGL